MPVSVSANLLEPTTKPRCNSVSVLLAITCALRRAHRRPIWPTSCVQFDYAGPDTYRTDNHGDWLDNREHFCALASRLSIAVQGWRSSPDRVFTVANASR